MAQTANAVTELAREHDEIDRLALRIATLSRGPERAALVREVSGRFLAHTRAEEQYLYPALRRLLADGMDLVCLQTRRNRALTRTIESLERGDEEGDGLDILVGHLIVGLQDHVERQDCLLLPALVRACPSAEMELIGRQLHEGVASARGAVVGVGPTASPERSEPPVPPEQFAQQEPRDLVSKASSAATESAVPAPAKSHGFKALISKTLIRRLFGLD